MKTCWQNKVHFQGRLPRAFWIIAGYCALYALVMAVLWQRPVFSASNQLQPVLKAIDPSQAKYDTSKPTQTTPSNTGPKGPTYRYQPYDDTSSGGPVPPTYSPSSVYGAGGQPNSSDS